MKAIALLILCASLTSCEVLKTNAGVTLSALKSNASVSVNAGKTEVGYETSVDASTRIFKVKPYVSIKAGYVLVPDVEPLLEK